MQIFLYFIKIELKRDYKSVDVLYDNYHCVRTQICKYFS